MSRRWVRVGFFTLCWVAATILFYYASNPYRNNMGPAIGTYLRAISLPIGVIFYLLLDRFVRRIRLPLYQSLVIALLPTPMQYGLVSAYILWMRA